MSIRPRDLWSVSSVEYLAGERTAATRSEWVDGLVYAMAGASKRHVQVVARLVGRLAPAAEALGCLLGASDLLVQTENAFYYPDIVVSCEPSSDDYVESQPCFIVEVLSPSTKRFDRHEKRNAYCELASLDDYWIVDPDVRVVEVYHRTDGGWTAEHLSADAVLRVSCLNLELRAIDIFGP